MTVDQMHAAAEAYRRTRYFRKLTSDVLHAVVGVSLLFLLGLAVLG